jgi:transcriptional regulator
LQQPEYAWPGTNRDLIQFVAEHPWVTMVSAADRGLVVTHLPVVPDPDADPDGDPVLLGHLPVTDADEHQLGSAETVLVVQGPHGYVSAEWYVGSPYVSTWNYVVAHLHGVGERLDDAGTLEVLRLTQDHFESRRPRPFDLGSVTDYVHRLAPYVVGFRLTPTRVVAKAKLSQDKPAADVDGVLAALVDPEEPFAQPVLAEVMRLVADHKAPIETFGASTNVPCPDPALASGHLADGAPVPPTARGAR